MTHLDPNATQYHLVTDSSNYAVGAALHQIINGESIPIGFYSRKLSESQKKYSTFNGELLAAYQAVLHFKPQIEGRNVTLFSDHKPLSQALKKKTSMKSDIQQRYLSIITEYVVDVSYIRGEDNIVADCLSRPVCVVTIDPCDLPAISESQKTDEELEKYKSQLKTYEIQASSIWCDLSTFTPRPYIPEPLCRRIFDMFHNISHPGPTLTTKIIKSRYFWPDIDRSIRTWAKDCLQCQQHEISRHTKTETTPFSLPSGRFETVLIDIIGPLPPTTTHDGVYTSPARYVLTCIDRATRWVEATPLQNTSASTIALAFLNTWISRFGVPLHVVTDRGSQFESELFRDLSTIIGFHRLRTTAYHPQTNGIIERLHRTLKTAIMARKQSWLDTLPIILLGIRNMPNDQGFSPVAAVTGIQLLLPKLIIDKEDPDLHGDDIRKIAKEM